MIKLPENIYWKKVESVFKFIGTELIVLFLVILSINNYLQEPEDHIGNADGKGYYDYLPSIFIRHDINRKDFTLEDNHEKYQFVSNSGHGFYVQYEDKYVNKYPSGTALLQLPFFLAEYWTSTNDAETLTGYEHSFQTSIYHAALFYLFIGLIFLKLFLRELKVKIWIIFFIQLLIALGTNVTFYTNFDSSFSHVYSLFAINAFLFVTLKYFNSGKLKFFVWACVLMGLILNLRQVNLLVILIMPFIAGSWQNLKQKVLLIFSNPKVLLAGLGLVFMIVFIQLYLWYLQTGHWIVYSYQNESFNFSDPHFVDILFSYKKGLFIYTPIVFLAILSSVNWLVKKEYYRFISWSLFFVMITYILSSWWSWFYGCSFGHRAYVEYYGVLFIPFAIFLNQIKSWISLTLLSVSLLVIPLNLIQSYQYSKYILHWIEMDEEKYWSVFLETHEKFEGLVWVEELDFDNLSVLGEDHLGTVVLKDTGEEVLYNINIADLPFDFSEVSFIVIKASGVYEKNMQARVSLYINDMGKGTYYFLHQPYLVHFSHEKFDESFEGYYKYAFPKMENITDDKIELKFLNSNTNTTLENVTVLYCN